MKIAGGQKGFTLIELVMVIAILGILSAVALPRFQDLQRAARIAATQGGLGAVRSALAIRFVQSGAAGGVPVYPGPANPPLFGAGDFADGQIPRNALQGNAGPRGILLLADAAALPAPLEVNAANGYWYYNGGANAGRVGAFSDGVVPTDQF